MGGIGGVVVQPEMENQPYGVTPVREAVSRNRTLFPVLLLAASPRGIYRLVPIPKGMGAAGGARQVVLRAPLGLGPWARQAGFFGAA